ncbi:hypothetical protein WDW86_08880 [Bdellovibrionota bacterium FG-2]
MKSALVTLVKGFVVLSGVLYLQSGYAAQPLQKAPAPASTSAPSSRTAPKTSYPTAEPGEPAKDWKGNPDAAIVHAGAHAGLGIVRGEPGFALMGSFSKMILPHGFIEDINDQASIETELGGVFASPFSAFVYSLHLRWDFLKDSDWTFFSFGGVGGDVVNGSNLMFPRFGVGLFRRFNDFLVWRAEVSHEVIAVGVSVPLY